MASRSFQFLSPPAFQTRVCQPFVRKSLYMEGQQQLRHRVTTKAQGDAKATEQKGPVQYEGSQKLKPFQTTGGKFFAVCGLLFGSIFRGGFGIFVDGYTLKIAKDTAEQGVYKSPGTIFGRRCIESTDTIRLMKRPAQPLEIYEFEGCPYCKKVREALSSLNLQVMFYPTPKGGPHHRAKVMELGGKQQFPYMVDPNTGKSMYESNAIIEYLYKEYGHGRIPLILRLGTLTTLTCALASISRIGRGVNYRKAKYPEQPLVLWGYELSPFSKIVREVLVELELPFRQIYCARGSPSRQILYEKMGAFQAPFLEDPNTNTQMFESAEIIKYLESTYAL